jgi:RNA polymerase primary sigma factor
MDELSTDDAAPRSDDHAVEPARSAELPLYATAMRRYPLLGRTGEYALADEIAAQSRALWAALLADPAGTALVARLAADVRRDALRVLRRVERASTHSPSELARAIDTASARLHALDVDHLLADAAIAHVATWPRDRATARYRRRVADAARLVTATRARFVHANIGLVFHMASRYRGVGLAFEDRVQEGMLGLIKAVGRYDPARGLRFSTYAVWWIRHAIGRAVTDKSRLVRVPVHMQEARQQLASIREALRAQLGEEPTREELARAAGLTPAKVRRIQEAAIGREISLDAALGEDDDRSVGEVFVHPAGAERTVDETLHREAVGAAAQRHLASLTALEREVLERRFALEREREETLAEIARDHDLSRERIRQIQDSALRKLRARLARHDE